jgi:hypothetical protein
MAQGGTQGGDLQATQAEIRSTVLYLLSQSWAYHGLGQRQLLALMRERGVQFRTTVAQMVLEQMEADGLAYAQTVPEILESGKTSEIKRKLYFLTPKGALEIHLDLRDREMGKLADEELRRVILERTFGKGAGQTRIKKGKSGIIAVGPTKLTRSDRKRLRKKQTKLGTPVKKFLAGYEDEILEVAELARSRTKRLAVLALMRKFLEKNKFGPITWEGPHTSFGTMNMEVDIKFDLRNPIWRRGL